MKTNIYVDGLNLYYRAVQGTPYKCCFGSRARSRIEFYTASAFLEI